MTRARVLHGSTLDNLIGLLIYDEGIVRVHTLDVVLTLLTTDDKDLVLGLDG